MSNDHPLGITNFELRDLAGHPHAWEEAENILVTERRVPGHEEWVITCRFLVLHSGLRLVGLNLEPASNYPWPPATPLDTRLAGSLRIGDIYQRARHALSTGQQLGIAMEMEASEFRDNRRPGKVGRPDIFFARLAVRYLQLVDTGSPTKLLAEELHVSQSTARDLIHAARRRGLLSESERGVAGGELTEKALRLLATHAEGSTAPPRGKSQGKRAVKEATSTTSKSTRPSQRASK